MPGDGGSCPELIVFGSTANGFGAPGSDVDVAIVASPGLVRSLAAEAVERASSGGGGGFGAPGLERPQRDSFFFLMQAAAARKRTGAKLRDEPLDFFS